MVTFVVVLALFYSTIILHSYFDSAIGLNKYSCLIVIVVAKYFITVLLQSLPRCCVYHVASPIVLQLVAVQALSLLHIPTVLIFNGLTVILVSHRMFILLLRHLYSISPTVVSLVNTCRLSKVCVVVIAGYQIVFLCSCSYFILNLKLWFVTVTKKEKFYLILYLYPSIFDALSHLISICL